jgi:anti-sigma regulatory factor (Ser/Thr protein kinase)
MSATLSLTLANRMDEVPRLVELLDAFGAGAGLPDDVVFRLTVSLDEVVTNIVRHGFATEGGHEILLSVTVRDGLVTAVVSDDAPAFDLRTIPPADVDAPIELRPIGGLGVHLVRSLTRELEYRRDADRNILTLKFATTFRSGNTDSQ